MTNWQRIIAVARRELRIIRQRPIYLLGSVGVIAFCAIFFLTFLKDGLPSDVPIGLVDYDYSSTSRNFCQQLDATQLGKVVRGCQRRHEQRQDRGCLCRSCGDER